MLIPLEHTVTRSSSDLRFAKEYILILAMMAQEDLDTLSCLSFSMATRDTCAMTVFRL